MIKLTLTQHKILICNAGHMINSIPKKIIIKIQLFLKFDDLITFYIKVYKCVERVVVGIIL